MAATELVLDLLTTFTEHIARAEWAAGANRQEPHLNKCLNNLRYEMAAARR